MSKLSVVIAHVPQSNLDVRLDKCIQSLGGNYDELVLVINDGIGFGKAYNRGFKYATGDYILAVSNDTVVLDGNIRDLCVPDVVTSPVVNEIMREDFWACFFCQPRNIMEQMKGFDESFGFAYYEDNDLTKRIKQAHISMAGIPTVKIEHEGGATIRTISTTDENMKIGRKRYVEKWGDDLG